MSGKLVIIEGSDGSGKGTQVDLLSKFLKSNKITHNHISFPRYKENMYGSFVRKYLDGDYGDPVKISPYLGSLAYASDRLLAQPQMVGWLKKGELVISDRYVPSSLAHHSAKLPTSERDSFITWLTKLEYGQNQLPVEDLVLYLYVPVVWSQKLMEGRVKDGHESNVGYLKEVEKQYIKLAKSKHWVKIDCVKNNQLLSREDIHHLIIQALKSRKIIS